MPELVTRQYLRILFVQPQWRARCGRRQIDADSSVAKHADDAIEPTEIPFMFSGLNAVPAENTQRHHIHIGFAHQPDVFDPYALGPLVRIVVTAVCDACSTATKQSWPFEFTTHCSILISENECAAGAKTTSGGVPRRIPVTGSGMLRASAGYSFTAPAASPDCQYFCRSRKAMTSGMMVIIDPVITRFWIA